MNTSRKSGFTLLEILLVVAAIGILAGIVIVAINPGKQLGNTKDAKRESNVSTIANAVYQYTIDNEGILPSTITTTATEICATGGDCTGLIDLSVLTTDGEYLTSIPLDPTGSDADTAGYTIEASANFKRITVAAPDAEEKASISITK